jgi:hypothetical protein
MSLQIRRLKLLVSTPNGEYGTDMRFPSGLVLIHKDNTRGKSTALKAIIYALGLERMFGPVDHPPLTPAMTARLKDGADEWPVVESWVFVEIANGDGKIATIRRKVSGDGGQDRKLINVWERSVLDEPQLQVAPMAFYARDPGSATREQGIYPFLADFIGWKLPEVLRYDGTKGPLYMECLVSLFFVEQSQGWTTIQAVTPRYFQIRQVEKKAIEFLLDLDACGIDTKRQQVEQDENVLRREWLAQRNDLDLSARSLGGALRELPLEPQAVWPPSSAPYIEVYVAGQAVPLSDAIELDRGTLRRLETEEIPSADQSATQLKEQLDEAYRQLSGAELLASDTRQELELEKANLTAIGTRRTTMLEDLDHHRGEKKVRDLGFVQGLAVAASECPTCHQPIEDSLLDQRQEQHVMTLDENIAALEAQIQTLERMGVRTSGAIEALKRRLDAVLNYADEVRGRIRSLRRTLTSAGSAPSEAAVRERLVLDERLQKRVTALDTFEQRVPEFAGLALRWRDIQARKAELKATVVTSNDQRKLDRLQQLVLDALSEFGFESFPVSSIKLDRE